MVEGAPLEREYTSKGYRGFESHVLRHFLSDHPKDDCLKNFGVQWIRIEIAGIQ